MNIGKLLQDAASHLEGGRLSEAEALYQQVLEIEPDHSHALHVLGLLHYQNGRMQDAAASLEKAIAVKPDFAEACLNLANIYAELEQLDDAVAKYRQAIAIAPTLIEAHYNLGALFQHQRRLDDAKRQYQAALVVKPDFAEARERLGEVLRLLAQDGAAPREDVAGITEASLEERLQNAQELCNKAALYQQQGNADAAMIRYQQAVATKPDLAAAHGNLGNLLTSSGRLEEALVSYQNVLALEPGDFIAYNNLGNVLKLLKRWEEAAVFTERAIALEPNNAQLYLNLGIILRERGKLEAAGAMCERALRLQPGFTTAVITLAQIREGQGLVKESIALRRQAQDLDPDNVVVGAGLLMPMHYLPEYSPEELLTAAKDWAARHRLRERCLPPPDNLADPQRRLRVGYVSADFYNHPVGYFIEAVLAHHDKSRYEVYCYYNNSKSDDLTKRLRQYADHWRVITGKSDQEIARQIRADGIDLLIDLAGHTAANRLPVFAHKPAPVQATWLGYFDTTGLDAMDYIIGDRFLIPPREEHFYVEQVVRLPNAYLCYSPPTHPIEPSPLPALATGKITFGCFHNTAKLTEAVIACWSKLLHALSDARLYLKYKPFADDGVRRRYQDLFARRGIAPDRIRFEGQSPRDQYLAAYHEVDIGLDTFPFNGCTTTAEALWMGVPVVSLRGDRYVSHMGETILINLGLEECVVDTEEAYIAKAAALAADLPRLAELRRNLRTQLLNSSLCDAAAFTRDLETAFRTMWESWCRTRD